MDKTPVADVLGELMNRTLRNGEPITEYQLEKESGVPQSTINRILNPHKKGGTKDPRTDTLKPLASFFKVTIQQMRKEEPLDRLPKHSSEAAAQPNINQPVYRSADDLAEFLSSLPDDVYNSIYNVIVQIASIADRPQEEGNKIEWSKAYSRNYPLDLKNSKQNEFDEYIVPVQEEKRTEDEDQEEAIKKGVGGKK